MQRRGEDLDKILMAAAAMHSQQAHLDRATVLALSPDGCEVALKHGHVHALFDQRCGQNEAANARAGNEDLQGSLRGIRNLVSAAGEQGAGDGGDGGRNAAAEASAARQAGAGDAPAPRSGIQSPACRARACVAVARTAAAPGHNWAHGSRAHAAQGGSAVCARWRDIARGLHRGVHFLCWQAGWVE
jgi:hypothetical protein